MTTPITLADHPDYRITLHRTKYRKEGVTPKMVITFGGQPADLADSGFGTKFCLSSGWDTIYVTQRVHTQYQGLSIEAFWDAIAEQCEGREVVCYGSSLGAYAALYYGGSLDARIVAAAPMLPAWKPLGLRPFADVEVTHQPMADGPLSTSVPIVMYDPMIPNDLRIVKEMVQPAYPDARLVEVPFGGHTVLATLGKAQLLKDVIVSMIDDDVILNFERPGEGTATYHGEKARYLMRTDKLAARAELEKSLVLAPSPRNLGALIKLLISTRDLDAAQQLIDRALSSGDPQMRIIQPVVEVATVAGLRLQVEAAG